MKLLFAQSTRCYDDYENNHNFENMKFLILIIQTGKQHQERLVRIKLKRFKGHLHKMDVIILFTLVTQIRGTIGKKHKIHHSFKLF